MDFMTHFGVRVPQTCRAYAATKTEGFFAVFGGILPNRRTVACGGIHVRIRFWKATARRFGKLRDDDWPGESQNRGFPAMRDPRAEARVGAVDEASTAAREGACAPRADHLPRSF